ncbi:MAG: sigma-70 family RNA polymerase sigma factor [Acidimicrobiia bacterium]|nr:sigma-70 family RNA polymerase sigma factor [Acidimicrobiia bacterium]
MSDEGLITQLLRRCDNGDLSALDELVPILYTDLRRVAHQRLRIDPKSDTLGTTALVNECYLRLLKNRQLGAEDRGAFLAAASQTMRRILVDYARTRGRQKRGGNQIPVPLENAEEWLSDGEKEELLQLDMALNKLKAMDPQAVQVVELRYFAGLSLEETAEVLGVSSKTVQRIWANARAWLRKEIASP